MGGNVPPDEVRFEIENIGDETSLTPTVVLTGYLPKPRGERRRRTTLGTRRRFDFRVKEVDRRLPPHSPARLTAVLPTEDIWGAELPDGEGDVLGFLWFKTYTFAPTRGRPLRYRVRSADGVRLSWVRFWLERFWFRARGTVEIPPQGTPRGRRASRR